MLNSYALRRVFLPLLLIVTAFGQSPTHAVVSAATNPGSNSSAAANAMEVPVHETLDYSIEWRLWTAGHAKLDWYSSPILKSGWETKLHLESTGVVSRLFHVTDDYSAQMTSELCATGTFMTAREGNRRRDTKVTFDSSARKADYLEKDLNTNQTVKKEIDIPACVHDVIGALYVLRTMNLEPGKAGQIPISNGKKSLSMKVQAEAREEIKVPAGPQKTMRYEVFAFDNQLYAKPGHLHVWLTDDKRRLPVQIQIRLQFTIGTITLRLDKGTAS